MTKKEIAEIIKIQFEMDEFTADDLTTAIILFKNYKYKKQRLQYFYCNRCSKALLDHQMKEYIHGHELKFCCPQCETEIKPTLESYSFMRASELAARYGWWD